MRAPGSRRNGHGLASRAVLGRIPERHRRADGARGTLAGAGDGTAVCLAFAAAVRRIRGDCCWASSLLLAAGLRRRQCRLLPSTRRPSPDMRPFDRHDALGRLVVLLLAAARRAAGGGDAVSRLSVWRACAIRRLGFAGAAACRRRCLDRPARQLLGLWPDRADASIGLYLSWLQGADRQPVAVRLSATASTTA